MREILFRGKRHDTGAWVEGDLRTSHFLASEDMPERWECSICVPDKKIPWAASVYDVDPETVGQYTGLDDKKGRKIFEGDLVKLDGWEPPAMQIAFIEGAFCLADADEAGEYCGDIHYIHHAGDNQTTVIGNIHDNPELLRGR